MVRSKNHHRIHRAVAVARAMPAWKVISRPAVPEIRRSTPPQTSAESEWVVTIKKELEKARADDEVGASAWPELTIYRIPQCLRNSDENAYIPQMVSLGPYHHGQKRLSAMERHKWRALHHVLHRNSQRIEDYLSAVKEIEKDARACYEGPINLSSEDFIKMLVLDSSFILELFRGNEQGFKSLGYSPSDPIFAMRVAMTSIQRDMIMLENQIPLFVLNKIHAIQCPDGTSVASLALGFFEPLVPTDEALPSTRAVTKDQSGLHCLDVFRRSLLAVCEEAKAESIGAREAEASPGICVDQETKHEIVSCEVRSRPPMERVTVREEVKADPIGARGAEAGSGACVDKETKQEIVAHEGQSRPPTGRVTDKHRQPMIHCVTELKEAGVKFKMKETDRICDIDFNNSVLKIPRLLVHDGTKSLFLNLIAFEQCHLECTNGVTSYAIFMDSLIDSSADVTYLHRRGIVENCLGNDVEVADLFNSLCHEVVFDIDDSTISELSEKVNRYYNHRWNAWRASLTHKYFNSPWSIISFFAAIVLVLLTLAQSFYAVYAYYVPPS